MGPAGPEGPVGATGATGPAGASPFSLNGNNAYYNAGYVGAGTSSPAAPMHVAGLGAALLIRPESMSVNQNTGIRFQDPDGGTNPIDMLYTDTGGNSLLDIYGGHMQINGSNLYLNQGNLIFPNSVGHKISLWADAPDQQYGLGIGIGPLLMYSSASNTDIAFGTGSASAFTESMRIRGNGRVGIGTSDPDAQLAFGNTFGSKISLYSNTPGANYGFGIQNSLMQMYTPGSIYDMAFGTGSSDSFTEAMRITGTRKIGVGTSTPAANFQVANGGLNGEAIRISGQSFSQGTGDNNGISLMLGVNATATNRQLWIGNSSNLTPNNTNSVIRLQPGGASPDSWISSLTTDGTSFKILNFQASNSTFHCPVSVVGTAAFNEDLLVNNDGLVGDAVRIRMPSNFYGGLFTEFASSPILDLSLNSRVTGTQNSAFGGTFRLDGRSNVNGALFTWLVKPIGTASETVIGGLTNAGNFSVTGSITGASKNFKIDHPSDPANKYLVHACIESNENINIYRGNVTLESDGTATIVMPSWMQDLNENFSYQLTGIGAPALLYVSQELTNNEFKIAGGQGGMKVSWTVTGTRKDAWVRANPMQVEQDKGADRGKYLHPELFNAPASSAIGHATVTTQQ